MLSEITQIFLTRDITKAHREQVACHLRHFATFAGNSLEAFTDDTVNQWLEFLLQENGRAPKTQRAYRASILNAWNAAYDSQLVDEQPGRIRMIRAPRKPPEAWTFEELCQLLKVCDDVDNGGWAAALIQLTWSTGMRLCDAYDVQVSRLESTGVYRFVQKKTRTPHVVRVNDKAIQSLKQIGGRLYLLTRKKISQLFRQLVKLAGVRYGTARWIRRSAASYVEKERPGSGQRFLGHKGTSVAHQHYFDPAIIGTVIDGPSLKLVS